MFDVKLPAEAKGQLKLLRIGAGRAMPEHGHGGEEITHGAEGRLSRPHGPLRPGRRCRSRRGRSSTSRWSSRMAIASASWQPNAPRASSRSPPASSSPSSASDGSCRQPLPWKTAWITGASTGIGRDIALQLAAAGVKVAASARSAEKLEALGPGILTIPLDVTDAAACRAAVDRIESRTGTHRPRRLRRRNLRACRHRRSRSRPLRPHDGHQLHGRGELPRRPGAAHDRHAAPAISHGLPRLPATSGCRRRLPMAPPRPR